MYRIQKTVFQIAVIITLLNMLVFAQNGVKPHVPSKERGDPRVRAQAQMEGNRVRATIFNFAFTGRTGGEFPIDVQTPYEWPKNTGHVYLALSGIFLGGEVKDSKGTLQHIIDAPTYRTSPEGKSWNL